MSPRLESSSFSNQAVLAESSERVVPAEQIASTEDSLVYLKHVALYEMAQGLCRSKRVMDLGCGAGYGSALLSDAAQWVVAVDNSLEAVSHASAKYGRPHLAFVVCDAQNLPFRDASFDAVVSFEVIEHVEKVKDYLGEIRRARVEGGPVIVSTPNRRLRLLPLQKPWNVFHRREYDDVGLGRVLRDSFGNVALRGVVGTPVIMEIEKRRVRQNPLIAYGRMLARVLLPPVVYAWLKLTKRVSAERLEGMTPSASAQFSASDFSVCDDKLNDCITLVAVCR